ncbi:MAG: hypothetical protein DMF56_13780 [Acidobacteria bacterium]|nr:MAG: hypothetical protein DMF56_13780 [Acidobacteriota bacterium]
MPLNIAGPEYDFGSVVYVVLGECEHRRRGFDDEQLKPQLLATARGKLAKIKAAYDEFGGSPAYWKTLETEVLETAMPQYIEHAAKMNRLERGGFDVFRGGDLASRFIFALVGLIVGSIIVELPFIPIFEALFAFILTGLGFFYPDLKRYMYERRHARMLNRLVTDAARYQQTSRLHYMTTDEIRESFQLPGETTHDADSSTRTDTATREIN